LGSFYAWSKRKIKIDGYTEDIMPLNSLDKKFEAFNWHTQVIDGHDFNQIIGAFGEAQAVFDRPSVIIANTIPGKGVAEFERRYEWHGKAPNKDEANMALKELRTLGGKIISEHE